MTTFGVSYRSYRVWQRNRDVFLRLWKTEIGPFLAEPLFILLAMGYGIGSFLGDQGGRSYLKFIAPGIVASYAMFSASFECTYSSFFRMQMQKTYDAIIVTPLNIEDVVAGEIFWGATRSLLTALAILLVSLTLGLISTPLALAIPLVSIVAGLLFASLAMLITSIVPSVYTFNYFFTLFITPMFFFSGVFFPLSSFPPVVQDLAWWLLPLTPLVEVTRGLFEGHASPAFLGNIAWALALTALFFVLSLRLMRRRLVK